MSITDAKTDEEALVILKKKRLEKSKMSGNAISQWYGLSDKWFIQRLVNPKAQYKYAYVLLDTSNAAAELSTDTKFGWRVINYRSLQSGTVSTVSNIRDLVGMRIFPFTMVLVAPVGESGKNYVNNVVNLNNSFNILIHEFAGQSYIGKNGIRFHFDLFPYLMNPSLANNTIKLVPYNVPANPYYEFVTSGRGNGWFWFEKPIVEFSTMTISIRNPFDLVKPNNTTRTLIPLQLVYLNEKNEK
jgi:hypothetical protein